MITSEPVWEFGEFRIDGRNQVLSRAGAPVKLSPQPFKGLLLIVSRGGELVTRKEMRETLWGGDVNVDFEHGLNTCLRQIRTALGDTGREPRIVQTVPRVGYRLVVPAHPVVEPPRRFGRWPPAFAAAASLALLVATVSDRFPSPRRLIPDQHLDAHELYVRGRIALDRRTEADAAVARQLFKKAAEREPSSALAHAGLALTYVSPLEIAGVTRREALARAEDAVTTAAADNPRDPTARVAAAMVKLAAGDWVHAEADLKSVLNDAPSNADAHRQYAIALHLYGRFDESLREGRRSVELDPLSPANVTTVGDTLRFARRYDEAIVEAEAALQLDPTFSPALHLLGLCYEAKGDYDRAIDFYRRSGWPSGNLGHAYAVAGRTAEARQLLDGFEAKYRESGIGAGHVAQIYIGLGELEEAFKWLEKLPAEGGRPTTLKVADVWDPVRGDPRFQALLKEMGLDD